MKRVLILLLIFTISCQKKDRKVSYHSNGKVSTIETYFKFKKLKERKTFDLKGELISELINIDKNRFKETLYFEGQKIYGYGKLDSLNRKIGWWKFFDNENHLSGRQEYMIINQKEYVNQGISYNLDGTIDVEHSRFFKLKFFKSKNKRCYIGYLYYLKKMGKKSEVMLCIGESLNRDFSNIDKVKLDTLLFKEVNIKKFPILFKSSGKKCIRGFVIERILQKPKNILKTGKINFIETFSYFQDSIYVR